REDVVFATAETSSKLAAYTGNTVMWGHWAQTVDFAERMAWFEETTSGRSPYDAATRRARFWDSGARWLFLEPPWKEDCPPPPANDILEGAEKVFENSAVAIYKRPVPGIN